MQIGSAVRRHLNSPVIHSRSIALVLEMDIHVNFDNSIARVQEKEIVSTFKTA